MSKCKQEVASSKDEQTTPTYAVGVGASNPFYYTRFYPYAVHMTLMLLRMGYRRAYLVDRPYPESS